MNQQTVQSCRSEENTVFFQRKQLFNTKPLLIKSNQSVKKMIMVFFWMLPLFLYGNDADIVNMTKEMTPVKINSEKSDGRITGKIMKNWRENSGWAKTWADYTIISKDGEKYLQIKVKKINHGYCQFDRLLKLPAGENIYKLTFSARIRGRGIIVFGVRMRNKPYKWLAKMKNSPSEQWQQYDYTFSLKSNPRVTVSLFFVIDNPMILDLKDVKLERCTGKVAETKVVRTNLFRNSCFPLGLPFGWNLYNSFSDGDVVKVFSDPKQRGPSGAAPLTIDCPEGAMSSYDYRDKLDIYTAPFAQPKKGKSYTASVYIRGKGQGAFSVYCDSKKLGEQTFNLNQDREWSRITVPFQPKESGIYFCTFKLKGYFQVDGIQVNAGQKAAPYRPQLDCEVALVLKPGAASAARIVFSDEPAEIGYVVTGKCTGAKLNFKITDLYGKEKTFSKKLVESGKTGTFKLEGFDKRPLGSFRIEAWVTRNKKNISTFSEIVIHRLRRPHYWGKDAPKSAFGIHIQPVNRHIIMAKAVGNNWVRLHDVVPLSWFFLERQPGKWTFDDAAINRYRNHKIKILGVLETAPPWESYASKSTVKPLSAKRTVTGPFFLPLDINKYAAYSDKVIKRYQKQIDCYNVWNEPWLPWFFHVDCVDKFPTEKKKWASFGKIWYISPDDPAAEFMKLQKTVYKAAKSVNPKFKVLGFNTTTGGEHEGRTPGKQFTAEMLALGAEKYCDVICYHDYQHQIVGYPGDAVSRAFQNTFTSLIKKYGKNFPHPVWMTEGSPLSAPSIGFYKHTIAGTSLGIMHAEQDMIVRYVVSQLANRVEKVFLYSMGVSYNFVCKNSHRLFVTPIGDLHPMGCAYSAMTWALEDKKFSKQIKVGVKVYAYIFSDGNWSTAVLLPDPRTPDYSYKLPMAASLEIVDMLGNPVKPGSAISGSATYVTAPVKPEELEKILTAESR